MTKTNYSGMIVLRMTAFTTIKEALTSASLLFHPKQEAPISIMTDTSSSAVGVVLQQYIDHQWCPITYFSKKLKPSDKVQYL